MPGRKVLLVTNQIYHVINRGVASQPIFLNHRDYQKALETLFYYQNFHLPMAHSFFLRLPLQVRKESLEKLRKQKNFWVEIITYCLMPNHFHLILKQNKEKGISVFMGNFSNSYTRYFNTKNKRVGHLFQSKFNAVRIETDEQLIHLSRYIHLNPYTAYLIKDIKDLRYYPYSSLLEYLNPKTQGFCNKEIILDNFRTPKDYLHFIFEQASYQRELDKIKHIIME